jgi:hypothetical protein
VTAVVFSMARVPLRTNFLQAARWWAEAQIFRPLASPRRPPAATGAHSKMPRETTSAVIAAFRLLRGPESSTCRVNRPGAIFGYAGISDASKRKFPCVGAPSGRDARMMVSARHSALGSYFAESILPTRAATLAAMMSDFDHATSRPLESRARS